MSDKIEYAVLAALGVIEDDIGEPVSIDEILLSLRADIKIKLNVSKIAGILQKLEKEGYVKNNQNKYSLLESGSQIVDTFLESQNI
jgi:predicted transcriptional regulator